LADEPKNQTPEAIQKHKVQQTLEMPGPDGSKIRQMQAEKLIEKDHQAQNSDRASKYANLERASIASKSDIENGTKGILSKDMNKASKDRDLDR